MWKVYNESTNNYEICTPELIYGVVGSHEDILEFGYFNPVIEDCAMVSLETGTYYVLKRTFQKPLYFNRLTGFYSFTSVSDVGFGSGNFPYTFPRYYSTRYLEDRFKRFHVIDNPILFEFIKEMPYTFGMEFETHSGYIPQDVIEKVGLIPLRDGSIHGLEYSTIVLHGNDGLNTLKRMVDVLKKYTIFDKECSLHIHFGNWNLKPEVILRLNNLFATSDIDNYLVPYAFKTSSYKANGKDYCTKNASRRSFQTLYSALVGREFFGDLFQPHPNDLTGDRKWNITTRYQGLNLINAICYSNGKTAEFRCLRPSYNFDKIICWLFILGAYIRYAENFKLDRINHVNVTSIISSVYSADLANMLLHFLTLQRSVVEAQTSLHDMHGGRVDVEDQILTREAISQDYKYFY